MIHIIKSKVGIPSELIRKFENLSSATIYEANDRTGYIDCAIKPVRRGIKLCGRALTVQCAPGDNLMLHKAIDVANEGDVIVADVSDAYCFGYWGDLMTVAAHTKKIEGLVINGGIRDSEDIIDIGFKVFCRNICIKGTNKSKLGLINYPVFFGGCLIKPGDLIFGDDDGLVAINHEIAEIVLNKAMKRVENENTKRSVLKKGVSSLEYNNLIKVLEDLGAVEE